MGDNSSLKTPFPSFETPRPKIVEKPSPKKFPFEVLNYKSALFGPFQSVLQFEPKRLIAFSLAL